MDDPKAFLSKLNKNLDTLQERKDKYAGNPPAELLDQIDGYKQAITLTEQCIEGKLSEAELREGLKQIMPGTKIRRSNVPSSVTIGDIEGGIHHSTIAGRDVNIYTEKTEFRMVVHNLPLGNEVSEISEPHFLSELHPKCASKPPDPFKDMLDRGEEVSKVTTALQAPQSVGIFGEVGIGKTVLLRHLAYQHITQNFSHGVFYFSVREKSLADLIQDFYRNCFKDISGTILAGDPFYQALQSLQALIILDHIELTRPKLEDLTKIQQELKDLRNIAPKCTFILASTVYQLWTEGPSVTLKGLSSPHDMALVKRYLDRPLKQNEGDDAETLCKLLEGHPERLIMATGLVKNGWISMANLIYRLKTGDPKQVLERLLEESLSESERKPVLLLAALKGVPLHREHLVALTEGYDVEPILDMLHQRGIVQVQNAYYVLSDTLSQTLQQTQDLTPWAERALDYFVAWVKQPQHTPERLLEEADTIRQIIDWAVETGHWTESLHLTEATEGFLALSGRWGAWEQMLQSGLKAAQALGDQPVEAWAYHQLGSRALCLNDAGAARAFLGKALRMREGLVDQAGAELTRHNLDLLTPLPPPPVTPLDPITSTLPTIALPTIAKSLILLGGIVTFMVVIGLGLGGLVIWWGWSQPTVDVDVEGIWLVELGGGSRLIRITEGGQSEVYPPGSIVSRHDLRGTYLEPTFCLDVDQVHDLFKSTQIEKNTADRPTRYKIWGEMALCPTIPLFYDKCKNLRDYYNQHFMPFRTEKVGTWIIAGTVDDTWIEDPGTGTCDITGKYELDFRLIRVSCPRNRPETIPDEEEMGEEEYREFLKTTVKEAIGQADSGPAVTIRDAIEQIDGAQCLPVD